MPRKEGPDLTNLRPNVFVVLYKSDKSNVLLELFRVI